MEGQRVEKGPGGSKKGLIAACAAVVVLLGAYLGLCAWVGSMDTIFPNVSVAGLDVSGMTVEEAQSALTRAVDENGRDMIGTVVYNGWKGSITAADMDYTWDFSARMAYEAGRENFFFQGGDYLTRVLGRRQALSAPRGGDQPAVDRLLDQMELEVAGDVTRAAWSLEGDRLVMTKGRTGVSFDRDAARESALSALEEAMEQKLGGGREGAVEMERQLFPEETPPQEPGFDEIYAQLHTQPVSAQMDPETFQITDHVVGVDFDAAELKAAYDRAEEGERFSIPVTLTQPKETKESLEAKLFKDLLGEGTSTVSGSANRKHNVKLSAEACNGRILLPGQEFSYNNTTGSRSADKGYLPAPVYVGGKSEDEVGGGICQTSSTIYYAVLHTTLEIVERRNHMYAVGYVPDGMDATVYYGSTDFRFKNNTEYPVKIVTQSYDKGGKRFLTVKIYGTNADGRYAVPQRSQYDWVQPTTRYQADETVPRGTLVLDKKQNAYIGRSAQTYRYIYEKDGTLAEKEDLGSSKYKMRPTLYHYNPLDGDPASWPNGVPPVPAATVDPGTTADPGAAAEPGGVPDPGETSESGTAPSDPGGGDTQPPEENLDEQPGQDAVQG